MGGTNNDELAQQNNELRQLIKDIWPLVLLQYPHVPSVIDELGEKYEELKERASGLGVEVE